MKTEEIKPYKRKRKGGHNKSVLVSGYMRRKKKHEIRYAEARPTQPAL